MLSTVDVELFALLAHYGDNDRSRPGWAHWPDVDLDLRRFRIGFVTARQRREPWPPADMGEEERLLCLRLAVFIERHFHDQERQRRACMKLGLPWPPGGMVRPFVWCWEPLFASFDATAAVTNGAALARTLNAGGDLPGGRVPLDHAVTHVVYPGDWQRDRIEVDLYDFGSRWVAGQVLVVSVDEVPVDPEMLPPPKAERAQERAQEWRGERVVDVEVVDPKLEEPIAELATDVVRAPFFPSGRTIGHVGSGGFVPGGGSSW